MSDGECLLQITGGKGPSEKDGVGLRGGVNHYLIFKESEGEVGRWEGGSGWVD